MKRKASCFVWHKKCISSDSIQVPPNLWPRRSSSCWWWSTSWVVWGSSSWERTLSRGTWLPCCWRNSSNRWSWLGNSKSRYLSTSLHLSSKSTEHAKQISFFLLCIILMKTIKGLSDQTNKKPLCAIALVFSLHMHARQIRTLKLEKQSLFNVLFFTHVHMSERSLRFKQTATCLQ